MHLLLIGRQFTGDTVIFPTCCKSLENDSVTRLLSVVHNIHWKSTPKCDCWLPYLNREGIRWIPINFPCKSIPDFCCRMRSNPPCPRTQWSVSTFRPRNWWLLSITSTWTHLTRQKSLPNIRYAFYISHTPAACVIHLRQCLCLLYSTVVLLMCSISEPPLIFLS